MRNQTKPPKVGKATKAN